MSEHERREDDPVTKKVKLFTDMLNRVGFPVVVCIWFAYQQYTQGRETIITLNSFKEVMVSLKTSIDQQNKILRHKQKQQDDE